jgi:DNA-binding NtrC family response regulator
MTNLCRYGAYLELLDPLRIPTGTTFRLSVKSSDLPEPMTLAARICHAHEDLGLGVQFLDVAPETLETLETLGRCQQGSDCRRLVGQSGTIKEVFKLIELVADKSCSVLITGETGTGKELVARALHEQSRRRRYSFVSINCGAIPEQLLEDELFGHVKGAYTSAHTSRIGRLEQANKGTLFLDEIGNMPQELQIKLLRVLQEKEFQRLGSNSTIKVDPRIIAATNQDLLALIKEKRFREDLYYRLNVFPIRLSPLRERHEDIPILAEHFIQRYCSLYATSTKKPSPVVLELLHAHDWPGNIRELENVIESAVILAGHSTALEVKHFPITLKQVKESALQNSDLELPDTGIDYQNVVSHVERSLLLEGLRRFGGNRSKTANFLKLKRTTLLEKMKRLAIEDELPSKLVDEGAMPFEDSAVIAANN